MINIAKPKSACLATHEVIQTGLALCSIMNLSGEVMGTVRHSLRHVVSDDCTACLNQLLDELPPAETGLPNLTNVLTKLDPELGSALAVLLAKRNTAQAQIAT